MSKFIKPAILTLLFIGVIVLGKQFLGGNLLSQVRSSTPGIEAIAKEVEAHSKADQHFYCTDAAYGKKIAQLANRKGFYFREDEDAPSLGDLMDQIHLLVWIKPASGEYPEQLGNVAAQFRFRPLAQTEHAYILIKPDRILSQEPPPPVETEQ